MEKRPGAVVSGAFVLIILCLGFFIIFLQAQAPEQDNPWNRLVKRPPPTDHTYLIKGPLKDGPSVTQACLSCHRSAAKEVMATTHWTWLGHEVRLPGYDHFVRIGKLNSINNFCIGIQSNWPLCTTCHAGYGWRDETFDFTYEKNVDCLICHDGTGTYRKEPGSAGLPAQDVDLLEVARKVSWPSRQNCGYCHFSGGGGDAVKHGDLDGTMYYPHERIDFHMGKLDFNCQDCHWTKKHDISGRSMSYGNDNTDRAPCTDCHSPKPHRRERLNLHTTAIACQTCHIPKMAVGAPTKMSWDWSTAGQDLKVQDPHVYLKIKGSFTFAMNVNPEYYWFNGRGEHYIQGDKIDPEKATPINQPLGGITDSTAKIWPFKVHRGKQIYDKKYNYLLVPKTYGKGGYWTEFDWDLAARLGSEATGLPYSGEYGFAPTEMYWVMTHMVAPKEKALQCTDCHGEHGRLDWKALGYGDDPASSSAWKQARNRKEAE